MRTFSAVAALAAAAALSLVPGSAPTASVGSGSVEGDGSSALITLASGDSLDLRLAHDRRAVTQRRWDATAGSWGATTVAWRDPKRQCGRLNARTSSDSVALLVECDPGQWWEEEPPGASVALYAAASATGSDSPAWLDKDLPGEAYDDPGISPDGQSAVWPFGEGAYVTWRPGEGFRKRAVNAKGEEYTRTAVISDDGTVSYAYGAPGIPRARQCGILIRSRLGDGAVTTQRLPFAGNGCGDTSFTNIDSDTLRFAGGSGVDLDYWTISRAVAGQPFAVTAIAPSAAPGLVTSKRGPYPTFYARPGSPFVSVAGGGARVWVQVYDQASQSWGPVRTLVNGTARCRTFGTYAVDTSQHYVAGVQCGGPKLWLYSADGLVWTQRRAGIDTLGTSPDRRVLAVPGRRVTALLSPNGVVELPYGARGRCALVLPTGADSAVYLRARAVRTGWPSLLSPSGPTGWERADRVDLPRPPGRCAALEWGYPETGTAYSVMGRGRGIDRGYTLRPRLRDGAYVFKAQRW